MPWKKDKEITNNIETENKSSHLIELVNITKTYGGIKTYINQIFLLMIEHSFQSCDHLDVESLL